MFVIRERLYAHPVDLVQQSTTYIGLGVEIVMSAVNLLNLTTQVYREFYIIGLKMTKLGRSKP